MSSDTALAESRKTPATVGSHLPNCLLPVPAPHSNTPSRDTSPAPSFVFMRSCALSAGVFRSCRPRGVPAALSSTRSSRRFRVPRAKTKSMPHAYRGLQTAKQRHLRIAVPQPHSPNNVRFWPARRPPHTQPGPCPGCRSACRTRASEHLEKQRRTVSPRSLCLHR